MNFLGSLLGYVLWAAYYVLNNFALAIIAFTLIVKLCLFPFSVKQQKSMAGTARLSKKQKELQEKYGNNKEKLTEEMNKLYEKEGVKPMGGCVTMIIPFIVLFGIFYAVAYPLSNVLHLNSTDVNNAIAYIDKIPGYVSTVATNYREINLLSIFPNIQAVPAIGEIFNAEQIAKILDFHSGFSTSGFNLLAIPQNYGFFSPYILIPALCLASNIGMQVISQRINGNQAGQQQGCMKVMMYGMPLFSAYIAYTVPCAMGFYWTISALLSLVQTVLLGKVFSAVNLTANSEARHAALLFENEAKVPYSYIPRETGTQNDIKNSNSKKKKK